MHATLRLLMFLALGVPAFAQVPVYTFQGNSAGDQLGTSVAGAGDVNNDGYDDLIVGSPLDDPNGSSSGRIYVYSGKDGSVLISSVGVSAGDEYGASVSGAGDVDGDGYADVIIGAPGDDTANGVDSGSVRVISGKFALPLYTFLGESAGDRFGSSVDGAGDYNGDGRADLVVGAPFTDVAGVHDVGAAYVYSGLTGNLIHALVPGPQHMSASMAFGWAVAGMGDTDLDGTDEVVIGAPFTESPIGLGHPEVGVDAGSVFVFSIHDNGHPHVIFGEASSWFGYSVAAAGDVDGDGQADYIAGAPFDDGSGIDAGVAYVIGPSSSPHTLVQLPGTTGQRLGWSVAGIVHTNGIPPDLVVGVPYADFFSANDIGMVRVYSVGSTGWSIVYTLLGSAAGDHFGLSVAAAGRVNGDTEGDFIIGAPHNDANGGLSGQARVYLYGASVPTPYCTAKTNSLGCVPGIAYSGAPSVSVGTFTVTASNVLNQKSGALLWSLSQATTPFHGGTLCVGSPIKRTPLQNSGGAVVGTDCSGSYAFVFTHAYLIAQGLSAGTTVNAQYWSRDSGFAPPDNVGLTKGLSFTVCP